MAQLFLQPDVHIINADKSGGDVKELSYTPKKNTKPEIYNQKPNEASHNGFSEAEIEILMNQTPKTPQNQRNIDNQKKSSNSQMKTPESANRKQDGIKTSHYQSNDDKRLELKKTADNQLNSILNISDLKTSDLGATNQFLYLLFQNQPQIAIANPYNVNGLLAANGVGIFPQDFGAFSQLIAQDPSNLMFTPNAAAYFGNGAASLGYMGNSAFLHGPGMNTVNMLTVDEQRKQQLIQNTQQSTAVQQTRGSNAQKPQYQSHENHPSTYVNTRTDANYPNNSTTDEQVDTENNSISKSVNKGGAAPAEVANAKRRRVRHCFNQYCQTDPENALLWSKVRVTGKMSCKVCEEAWKNQQYCYFCKQIYLEDGDAFNDTKPWIGCDSCERWIHTECEDKTLQKRIKWHQDRSEDFEYKCPNCRPKTKTPGRGKPRRNTVTPQINENSRTGFDHPVDEEFEEDPLRKQVKLNPESPEVKYAELNTNSNSNVIAPDETCVAKKKLENMFHKHMQKRRIQFSKPVVHVDTYAVIDNLLNQHGKKLQLTENEVQHDLMMMRDASKTASSDNSSPMEEQFVYPRNYESLNNRTSHFNCAESEKKNGSRTRTGVRGTNPRRGNAAEKAFHDMQEDVPHKEEIDSEYVPTGQPKRQTRGKR